MIVVVVELATLFEPGCLWMGRSPHYQLIKVHIRNWSLVWSNLKGQLGVHRWRRIASITIVRKLEAWVVDQLAAVFRASFLILQIHRIFACNDLVELHWIVYFCQFVVSALALYSHLLTTVFFYSLHSVVHFLLRVRWFTRRYFFNSTRLWQYLVWVIHYDILRLLTCISS